jgi:hypothetical protein
MRMIRMVIALIAVCVAIVMGLRGRKSWTGYVSDEQGTRLIGAAAILVRDGRVLASTTTDSSGRFRLPVSTDSDTAQHVVLCHQGREPYTLQAMAVPTSRNRRPDSFVLLLPARADFETPYIASLRAVLPSECR